MLTIERLKKRLKIFTGDFRAKELTEAEKNSREYKMVKPLMGAGKFTDLQLSAVLEALEASSGLSLGDMVSKLKTSSVNMGVPLRKPFIVFKLTTNASGHNYPLNTPLVTWLYATGTGGSYRPDGSIGNGYSSDVATAVLCTDEEIDAIPVAQLEPVLRQYNS